MCPSVLSRSVVSHSATPWTVACQAPASMRFPRQEYWSGLPFPPPGFFSTQSLNPSLLCLLHCRWILYPLSHQGHQWLTENPSLYNVKICSLWALNQLSMLQVPAMANKSLYMVDHFYLGRQVPMTLRNPREKPGINNRLLFFLIFCWKQVIERGEIQIFCKSSNCGILETVLPAGKEGRCPSTSSSPQEGHLIPFLIVQVPKTRV